MHENLFDVSNEVVIITGASGQLGMSYQNAFLERGATVVGLDIKSSRLIQQIQDQYGDKYNPDATYKIVRPQGPRPEDINSREYYEYELWDATYGDTHDPLTGYPLIEGLDKTLIPNSGVAN